MKSLFNRYLDARISVYPAKFFSDLVSLRTQSIYPDGKSKSPNLSTATSFDPFQFVKYVSQSRNYTLKDAKIIHAHLVITNAFHSNIKFANGLLQLCCKASAFSYALRLFDTIPEPDTRSWNLIISCQNQNHLHEESCRIFCRMHSSGFLPNEFTYGSVLSACMALGFHNGGRQIYSLAFRHGFSSDGYVRSRMIDLFLKTCSFNEALKVFWDESCGNVVCWNAIISGATKHNQDDMALYLFRQMSRGFLSPSRFTFPSVFTACAKLDELELGRAVHGLVIKYGDEGDMFVGTAIVDFYAKCGLVDEAVKKFTWMPIRNVVSWTAIITGFVQKGDCQSALQLFRDMIMLREEINNYTVTSVLSACAMPTMLIEAVQIQCWIYKTGFYSDSTVKNSLINLYSKTGAIDLSEQIFIDANDLMDPSTLASMITAFSQNGTLERALSLLRRMIEKGVRPDKSCISSVLSITNGIDLGKQIHCYALKTGIFFDVLVGSSIFTMYSKCGSLTASYEVFKLMPVKDNVAWASMIAGFAEHGCAYQAVELFREMLSHDAIPDETTLAAVLAACSSLRLLKFGKEIHGFSIRQGRQHSEYIYGGSAMVNMYSRCGALKLARRVFDMMPSKDPISCSTIISGYTQSGYNEEALQLFLELLASDLEVDSFTTSSVLGAVGDLKRSDIGSQLHSCIIKLGLESEASVGSSLVMMYSMCGSIDDCRKGFDQIEKPDLVNWTTMIASYAQHGKGLEALKAYECMKKSGIKPDSVTFAGVLSACSHSGLVEEGYNHLTSMVKDYGIQPGQRHYACMVDLLGRSGRLKEAERFINSMPVKPDALVWATLLAACKVHGEVEIGRTAAEKYIELEPSSSDGAYVALSNICADVGQWEEVLKIRNEMKGSRVKKEPGWSYA